MASLGHWTPENDEGHQIRNRRMFHPLRMKQRDLKYLSCRESSGLRLEKTPGSSKAFWGGKLLEPPDMFFLQISETKIST